MLGNCLVHLPRHRTLRAPKNSKVPGVDHFLGVHRKSLARINDCGNFEKMFKTMATMIGVLASI